MEDSGKLTYQLNVKISEAMRDKIKEVSSIEKRPQSWVIRDLLDEWLDDYFRDKE